jgi:hypothetical protein
MWIDLSDDETTALLRELDRDRYPFGPRIRTLPAIRAKLSPEPAREPQSAEEFTRRRIRQIPWGACRQIWLRLLGTDGSQTHRRREMDSNHRFRAR